MKKISSLMLLALVFLLSCRTDQFPEKETYNNTSAFQLTSKRISLNESKHKAKLLPELEQVENKFKTFSKNNAQSKLVNYGDGVSIDTESVIYIENGPNYHTYTFKIIRKNAPADAPVENLVLSPLSDGTYREMLVTYDLTSQEKNTILSGGGIDFSGKIGYTPLQSGTYSAGLIQKTNDNCYWLVDYSFTTCSEGVHNHGEMADEDGGICQAEVQSVIVVKSADYVCSNPGGSDPGPIYNPGNTTYPGTNPSTEPGAPTGGSTTDPTGTSSPCGEGGISTQPQDPSSTLENQPCNNGTPTLPNLSTEHFKFNQIISQLSPALQSWINQPYNAEVYTYFINYFTYNNQSLEAGNFVKWSFNFLHQNQNVTLEQFQNWFIDGYSDLYKTKLTLLSTTELQDFVNINKEIDASPYDEEFVKETNEAFVAFTAYGDLETMTEAQIQTVLNQCCPSIIIVPQALTLEKSRLIVANYHFNRKFYPEWTKAECFLEAIREVGQLLLDLGGLVPVIGEVCDLTNATIYAINGDGLNASLSAASAIPVAGWFAAGTKFSVKIVNKTASDIGSRQVLKWIVGNDGLIKFGYSSQLRKVLKLTDATKQAHHIIPWAYNIQIHSVVQKAAKSADAFHLNEALNGIAVASWRNQPNHQAYNNRIWDKLEAYRISKPNATPQECYNKLLEILNQAKQAIINNPNTHLNNLVF